MQDLIDISKIPSPCKWSIYVTRIGEWPFACRLSETIRGRNIESVGYGMTPQEAVDKAIKDFTS